MNVNVSDFTFTTYIPFKIIITVCTAALDNPSDGAPDTPDPHNGGIHHTCCGG